MSKDGFNIKEGVLNVLKSLLKNEEFIDAVIDLILGKPGAGKEAKSMLEKESYSQTLNEAVAIHRVMKQCLNEEEEPEEKEDKEEGGLKHFFKMLWELRKKSAKFKRKVTWKAIKKPGVLVALIRLIATEGTDAVALKTVLVAFGEAAVEVAEEDEEFKDFKLSLAEGVEGAMPINIFAGRCQPFTLAHLKCLEAAKEQEGLKTLLCTIPGRGDESRPIYGELQEKMLNALKEAYPDLIEDWAFIERSFTSFWLPEAEKRNLEPVSLSCGTDRIEMYRKTVLGYAEKYGLNPDFKLIHVDRGEDDISATKAREFLINDDREGFESIVPECLYDMYDEFRSAVLKANGMEVPAQYGALSEICGLRGFRAPINEEIGNFIRKNRKL